MVVRSHATYSTAPITDFIVGLFFGLLCGVVEVFHRTNQIGWTARLDEDDEWWKPREHLELLCMQPKNDYFGSQIVAGKCKKHNSKQQWEIVGDKVRHTPS